MHLDFFEFVSHDMDRLSCNFGLVAGRQVRAEIDQSLVHLTLDQSAVNVNGRNNTKQIKVHCSFLFI